MGWSGCRLGDGLSQEATEWANTQRCIVTSVWFGQELIPEKVQEKSVETIKEKLPSIICSVSGNDRNH